MGVACDVSSDVGRVEDGCVSEEGGETLNGGRVDEVGRLSVAADDGGILGMNGGIDGGTLGLKEGIDGGALGLKEGIDWGAFGFN